MKEKTFRRQSSRVLKVLVVGNASAGKSSLVRRYVHGDFGNGAHDGADFRRTFDMERHCTVCNCGI